MRGCVFLQRREPGEPTEVMPWQVVAASTWEDCRCPWDVGDYQTRDCEWPDCQLSIMFGDRGLGADPRECAGRVYESQVAQAAARGALKPEWQKLWG